jgi:four helix bundle protein
MTDAQPFAVTFRDDNPHASQRVGVYEQALAFAALVDGILDKAEGRFHLKDTLDRGSTAVAMRIAQAAGELAKGDRRSQYRNALRHATDCAAVLDILSRRGAIHAELYEPARTLIAALIAQLAHLATR